MKSAFEVSKGPVAAGLLERLPSGGFIRLGDLASRPARPGRPERRGVLPIAESTIWRWVKEGRFPKPTKINGSTLWPCDEVRAFITGQIEQKR
ncbi:MAG: hypothetical protein DI561_04595 [Thauera sp.]|nr:MAG: hypothetical protein DI561_04595 [Thauera sp.]